jgi:gas vesicle protein
MTFALAMLTGAVVGGGAALLFAPRSGKETRGWLAHRTRALKGTASNVYAQGMGQDRATLSKPTPTPMRG